MKDFNDLDSLAIKIETETYRITDEIIDYLKHEI